jgi:hypothetical protein
MDRSEGPIDEHLDRDAGSGIEPFHLRGCAGPRQLGFIKVPYMRIRFLRS